ncbi:MAG: HEAT repeat domain-containing protein [Spirochaetaceae bacterium]|nr:HEAT repeat domain-containing protein [Spirochaetaceae bacterium]
MPAPVLLTDQQVQDYLTHGYLVLRTGHPAAVHRSILRQIATLYATEGNPGNDILPRVPDLYRILGDPVVDGALRSLLGADYLVHPHRHCHENPSGSDGQEMHRDSYENDQNVRHHRTRWAMAFYYPQDVPLEMGPTAILPASQYYESRAQAHQHKELALCGAAGTVTVVHYDLWHRAMANTSGRHRYMVKFLFTRMSEPRSAAWDHRAAAFDTTDDDPPAALRRRMWDWMRAAEWSPAPDERSLDGWGQALEQSAEAERLRAAYALASRGADAVPHLVAALRRQAAGLRDRNLAADHTNPSQLDAVFGLSAVGAPAVPAVAALLDDDAWWVRAAAADVLGDMGETAHETVPQLTGVLADDSVWARRNAIEALGYLGPAAATAVPSLRRCLADALSRCLADSDSRVRHNAALTLAKLGPAAAAATPALRRATTDEEVYTRANAAVALDRIL